MIKRILLRLSLICIVGTFANAYAIEEADLKQMEKMSDDLDEISGYLQRGQFDGNDLQVWTKTSIKMESKASLCVSEQEAAIADLKTLIEGLGEKVEGEDAEVTTKRNNFKQQKEELDKLLAKCNLFVAESKEVADLITAAEKSYFQQKFLARSPHMLSLVKSYLDNPFDVFFKSGSFIFEHSGIRDVSAYEVLLSSTCVMLAVAFGVWIRKKFLLLEQSRQWQHHFTGDFTRAFLTTVGCAAPYILGSGAAALSSVIISLEVAEVPFMTQFFVGLLFYFLTTTLIRLFFSPIPPAVMFVSFTPTIAHSLSVRLRTLAVLGLVGYLAFYTVFSDNIIETHLLLLRNIFSLFLVINIVWTLAAIMTSPKLPRLRYVTIFVLLVVIASLVAEWMGYRNLAFATRQVILLTFIVFLVFIGISKIFSDLYDAIDHGSYGWCKRIHQTLGVEAGNRVPGLVWIRLLTSILIWGSFAILFINSWDYSGGVIEMIRGYLVDGFDIGDVRIVPARMLWALLIFGGVLMLSGWFRSQLENNWLKLTNMNQGARDAVVTISGYVLFIIAFLAGLSAAGFNFGSLAIIAGALSVGIGFGLQNIVNNFVSGLILLFERPISKGDWVSVNGTEGFVRDIQIRSTRIETFDRSDVVVPNSELISNQVTNWMLSSRIGRATIPVGVAYGSDVDRVKEILLEIGRNHPSVSKSSFVPEPVVLFREFGDSSLNFELRVFLTDVNERLNTISDINFAIDKAFREAGVEIPFPQRDLHVRSLPEQMPLAGKSGEAPGKQESDKS